MKQTKEIYVSPQIEVIQVENEGVIAASGNLPGVGDGGDAFSRSNQASAQSSQVKQLRHRR